jgi:hypothetical protein
MPTRSRPSCGKVRSRWEDSLGPSPSWPHCQTWDSSCLRSIVRSLRPSLNVHTIQAEICKEPAKPGNQPKPLIRRLSQPYCH